jgi:hypothetical protein
LFLLHADVIKMVEAISINARFFIIVRIKIYYCTSVN